MTKPVSEMTFEERCDICERCIPESPFRDRMIALHKAMLGDLRGEQTRQRLLEKYGIGLHWYVHSTHGSVWYATFRYDDYAYETANCSTRRKAEDKAIAQYEALICGVDPDA